MSRGAPGRAPELLRVDPVACEAVGICAHLAPRLVTVDSWGYPIVSEQPIERRGRRSAVAAVNACPRRALFIEAAPVRT